MDSQVAAASLSPATQLILKINDVIVNPLIILMFAFALVAFLWGVRSYVTNADNTEARMKGSQQILWGVLGMGMMITAFAIERIVIQTFGISNDNVTSQNINVILK